MDDLEKKPKRKLWLKVIIGLMLIAIIINCFLTFLVAIKVYSTPSFPLQGNFQNSPRFQLNQNGTRLN